MSSRAERTVTHADSVSLRVARARPADVGSGVARISSEVMHALGVAAGDTVEIAGKRRTAASANLLPLEDRGLDVIRLEGLVRVNAGAAIGEHVTVRRLHPAPARLVRLSSWHLDPALDNTDGLARRLHGKVLGAGDLVSTSPLAEPTLGQERFHVLYTEPAGLVVVTATTRIDLVPDTADAEIPERETITYDDVGGLGDAVRQIREIVELPLTHPELFRELGITPPRGVLIHGPPGTGKTLLARAVAGESNAQFLYVAGPEIVGPQLGESERRLRELFREARTRAPSIIFIDEIDSIAPKRSNWVSDSERRTVAQLLMLMDGLEPRGNVIVLAATNSPDRLDEALRRPGRFDREISVGAPDEDGRRDILRIQTRGVPLAADVDLDDLARSTFGFVGADIAALIREAALEALRGVPFASHSADQETAIDRGRRLQISIDDFRSARRRVQPSALRELVIQTPVVRWEDIGGLDDAKRTLRDGIELQLTNAAGFRRLGIRPAKGFLLFGPPGTGKTLLAKAVAHEANAHFLVARCTDILSKWFGESEQQLARLFARARQVAPTIIFFDEIDALAPQRGSHLGDPAVIERIVNTLLAEMDGLQELHGVIVIAATNRPTLLDTALLRPGRFDELIYVSVPDRVGRRHILGALTAAMRLATDVDLDSLSQRTEGFTGADLQGLVRRAGLGALRERTDAQETRMADFEEALRDSHASVTPEIEREYETLLVDLKRESARARRMGFLQDRER